MFEGSLGSIHDGFDFRTRVCDLIEQFDFPKPVRDDAKRMAMDVEKRYTPSMTAITCLYISSDLNKYDFKNSIDDVLSKYRSAGNGFQPLKKTDSNIKQFIYEVKKRANNIGLGGEINVLINMHSLENGTDSGEMNFGNLRLGSPNCESKPSSQVVMPVFGV